MLSAQKTNYQALVAIAILAFIACLYGLYISSLADGIIAKFKKTYEISHPDLWLPNE
ncbi:MAG: hypothetical protein ABIG90_02325 [bacterium]